jgi:hypothetical protein
MFTLTGFRDRSYSNSTLSYAQLQHVFQEASVSPRVVVHNKVNGVFGEGNFPAIDMLPIMLNSLLLTVLLFYKKCSKGCGVFDKADVKECLQEEHMQFAEDIDVDKQVDDALEIM